MSYSMKEGAIIALQIPIFFRISTSCVESRRIRAATRVFFKQPEWLSLASLPVHRVCLHSSYVGGNNGAT